jgi:adenylate cyclase
MDEVERRLAAILSADAAGFTRLMAEDDVATLRAITASRDLLSELVGRHGGRVVDSPGDNLLAEFPSVLEAVRCADSAQQELQALNAELPAERRMLFRLGIHLGEILVEGARIYGDGVNIAARIESLGGAGGVTLSAAAFDQVDGKLPLEFEDGGEHALKNLPRPVRIFHLVSKGAEKSDADASSVPGFAGRPAIAVLPFDNMSGDSEQEFFADGLAEDLITRLASFRWFPVIARNSTFTYKGKAVDLKRVGRELGARYLVEGSVRKAGQHVRVTAQLIDASSGHHLWAERFDRDLDDVFVLQDEIASAIANRVSPEIRRAEPTRVLRRNPASLDAWETFIRGMWYAEQVVMRPVHEENLEARRLFTVAAERDPHFAPAHFGLALTHVHDAMNSWCDRDEAMANARASARRSVSLDELDAFAQHGLGMALLLSGETEPATHAFERAVSLDPSLTPPRWGLGLALFRQGHAEEASERISQAIRLSPRDPLLPIFAYTLSAIRFDQERFEDASKAAELALEHDPELARAWRMLAVSQFALGHTDEAKRTLEHAIRFDPEMTVQKTISASHLFGSSEKFRERLIDSLRQAGLPEGT